MITVMIFFRQMSSEKLQQCPIEKHEYEIHQKYRRRWQLDI